VETSITAFRQHTVYEPAMDLAGFEVRASDGRLGRIDGRLDRDGRAGTGVQGRGSTGVVPVLLPVGAIVSIDLTDRVVYLDRTREEIRNARALGRSGPCYFLREFGGAAAGG
jgi:hypothetical protein